MKLYIPYAIASVFTLTQSKFELNSTFMYVQQF